MQREALDLRAQVTELKSQISVPSVSATKVAEAVCERGRYFLLLQVVAAQVQGQQASYIETASVKSSQSSLRYRQALLLSLHKSCSPSYQ